MKLIEQLGYTFEKKKGDVWHYKKGRSHLSFYQDTDDIAVTIERGSNGDDEIKAVYESFLFKDLVDKGFFTIEYFPEDSIIIMTHNQHPERQLMIDTVSKEYSATKAVYAPGVIPELYSAVNHMLFEKYISFLEGGLR